MAYVTGLIVIEAPASALNNSGANRDSRTHNAVATKFISTPDGRYPYVSAQAYRSWLRRMLELGRGGWISAPVFREGKVAYTDANPIEFWDDDLFGYMRAPARARSASSTPSGEAARGTLLEPKREVTRSSPFRVGTFVSIGPVAIVEDYGVMARQDGHPVPHEHQFYRAHLAAPFSIDLASAGTFYDGEAGAYRNLDSHRRRAAEDRGLERVTVRGVAAYRLPLAERCRRVAALLRAIPCVSGGAKQTLHLTDVTPALVVVAVTRGGNHPLARVVTGSRRTSFRFRDDVLEEALRVHAGDLVGAVRIGWARGYEDGERERLAGSAALAGIGIRHPREVLEDLALTIEAANDEARSWMESP